ncbi:MAG TPA: ABC transporter permease [Polyangiales bacterium]|nr:ABC transporter permease [Polyangiales bacterium]
MSAATQRGPEPRPVALALADAPALDQERRSSLVRAIPRVRVERRPQRRRLGPGKRIPYGFALGPLLLLVAWALASWTGILDPRVLSEPWTVVSTAFDLITSHRLQDHLVTSTRRALFGLTIGVSAGTVLALICGLTRIGEALFDGPIQMKRAVPTLGLLPLLILWLGIGEAMKTVTIALTTLIPVYMHTHAGLRAIDARYVELAETVNVSRWRFLRLVALPGALPGFLMGLRLATTSAWLALVVVEQINAESGIGYMMSLARSYGQTEIILVGLLVYGIFGLTSDTAVRLLERRLLVWRRVLAG